MSIHAARAARVEAQRQPVDGRLATARKERADAATARAVPVTSPWSRLEWVREDEALSRVLIPLD
jgi:hypothetical protein